MDWRGPDVARRRVLVIAAGGVMTGIASLAGCAGGGQPAAAPGGTRRPPTTLTGATAPPATGTAPAAATAAPASPAATRGLVGAPSSAEPSHLPGHPAAHPRATQTAGPAGGAAGGQPVYYLNDGPQAIALTIDDGPSPVYTPQVLRVLEKYGVRATFSMVGVNVSYYPAIAREVAAAGHTIINHTWDHARLTALSPARQQAEIARATDAIHAATGVLPRMFRAPYGIWSRAALAYCASERLIPLDWSVDPRDWSRPGVSAIAKTIMRTTRPGSIILEHDGGGDRSQTVAALNIVLPRLLGEGYRFTIP
jgi:peptidoglycan/xylan/chitin deacetylase (PgdA/CDA1 family)